MSARPTGEIHCPGCNADTLLIREPVYEGFQKTGETLKCSSCGHAFEAEDDLPVVASKKVQVFTEADRVLGPEIFEDDEASCLCRYCNNYIVNPFRQWCSLHKKDVEATDTCEKFERKPDPPPDEEEEEPEKPPVLI